MPLSTMELDQHESQVETLQRLLGERDAEIAALKAALSKARATRAISAAGEAARASYIATADKPAKPITTTLPDGKPNPWHPSHWNITRQLEIDEKTPDLAERLAAEAGAPAFSRRK